MFSLEETTLWTAKEALDRLNQVKPDSWTLNYLEEAGWHKASLIDEQGVVQWSNEHSDPKILFLDALGWLYVRSGEVKYPVWRPRKSEVPLYRPPVLDMIPDPPDLDPSEVDAVYKGRTR